MGFSAENSVAFCYPKSHRGGPSGGFVSSNVGKWLRVGMCPDQNLLSRRLGDVLKPGRHYCHKLNFARDLSNKFC